MTIAYAYRIQISESLDAFRKQPDWTKKKIYTETFRVDGEPTREQVREMMRTMLAERFGLQVHEFTREGTVNKLVMSKPGVPGPNLNRTRRKRVARRRQTHRWATQPTRPRCRWRTAASCGMTCREMCYTLR